MTTIAGHQIDKKILIIVAIHTTHKTVRKTLGVIPVTLRIGITTRPVTLNIATTTRRRRRTIDH
jgi:hypothetical protein